MGTSLPETCREVEINILRSSVHLLGFIWTCDYYQCLVLIKPCHNLKSELCLYCRVIQNNQMGTVIFYTWDIALTLLQLHVSSLEQFSPFTLFADMFPNFYSLTLRNGSIFYHGAVAPSGPSPPHYRGFMIKLS